MGTVYLPTKTGQDEANARMNSLMASFDAFKQTLPASMVATVTVRLNWDGQAYDAPTDAGVVAELLNGARVVLREQGVEYPYEARITSLTNFTASFRLPVTTASKVNMSSVGVVLGKSATKGYAVASDNFTLYGGADLTIYLNMKPVDGEVVEMFRAQPYSADPANASDARLKAGNSYLGTRITTSDGTVTHLGHWTYGMGEWVDTSLTKVSIWDCPADGSTPTERVISTAASTDGWVPLDERLDCIRNIKIGTLAFTGDSATVGDNKMVRYDRLWVKQTRETLNMPIADEGGTLVDNYVDCVVRWYANTQVDGDYHLHPLFEKYERQDDGTYATTQCAHGYIARYPIGNVQSLAIGGGTYTVPRWKSGEGREYLYGNRAKCLEVCRTLNKCTAGLYFDDDGDGVEELVATIQPDASNRTFGVAGTAEISFLQWMSYLHFGVNVQGAASVNDPSQNIFPGLCTGSANTVANGATDHIVDPANHAAWGFKVWSGAVDTHSPFNPIVFLGVEDALWSSTGWYWEDVTIVTRRTVVTDGTGAIQSNTASTGWLFAQDAADVDPGSSDLVNETVTVDSASWEGRLLASGYRLTEFDASDGGAFYRAGVDTTPVLRDACLPAKLAGQYGVNVGAVDGYARISTPADFPTFSGTADYAVGDYCKYDSRLYRCTVAHESSDWDDSHFEAVVDTTVTRRTYSLVALGAYRYNGSSLGSFYVYAYYGLASAYGNDWRARPFLREVS